MVNIGPEPKPTSDPPGIQDDYHRVTIPLPMTVDRQVRRIQGEIILKEGRQCSYTEVLLLLIERGLTQSIAT